MQDRLETMRGPALALLVLLTLAIAPCSAADSRHNDHPQTAKSDNDGPVNVDSLHHPLVWRQPASISSLDLYWGEGAKEGQPASPFHFEQEDKRGTNPKFDVRDANGVRWRVKLGTEARPEVVSSRLLWAAGFFVNDDYLIDAAEIDGIHLHRGGRLAKGGHIHDARFARKPEDDKKIGTWSWRNNPLAGTREFNALRVMMALLNNWDLKDVNNAVYHNKQTGDDVLLVSDVGATFGTNGLSWTRRGSKGSVEAYRRSKFIERTTETTVSFATPKPPAAMVFKTLGLATRRYLQRRRLDWIGRDIPRQDARWLGSLLAQLSHQQIVDAFRAGHFPPEQVEEYARLVEQRIQALKQL